MPGRLTTFRRFLGRGVLTGAMLISPLYFLAQDSNPATTSVSATSAPAEAKAWWQTITANGFASLSYGYNTNQPYDRLNQFRVFDFNVNMIAGSGVPEVTAAYGMFRNMDTNIAHHFDIPELYVSYIAPLGKG